LPLPYFRERGIRMNIHERRVAKIMYFYYMNKLEPYNAGNLSAAVRESFAIKALKWAERMGEDA